MNITHCKCCGSFYTSPVNSNPITPTPSGNISTSDFKETIVYKTLEDRKVEIWKIIVDALYNEDRKTFMATNIMQALMPYIEVVNAKIEPVTPSTPISIKEKDEQMIGSLRKVCDVLEKEKEELTEAIIHFTDELRKNHNAVLKNIDVNWKYKKLFLFLAGISDEYYQTH